MRMVKVGLYDGNVQKRLSHQGTDEPIPFSAYLLAVSCIKLEKSEGELDFSKGAFVLLEDAGEGKFKVSLRHSKMGKDLLVVTGSFESCYTIPSTKREEDRKLLMHVGKLIESAYEYVDNDALISQIQITLGYNPRLVVKEVNLMLE